MVMNERNQDVATIQCPECGTRGRVKASAIPPRGARFVCPKCRHQFHVSKEAIPSSAASMPDAREAVRPRGAVHGPSDPVSHHSSAKTAHVPESSAPVHLHTRSAAVKLCTHCGLFIREDAEQCRHCGKTQTYALKGSSAPARSLEPDSGEESIHRQNVGRYLLELALLAVLAVILVAVNRPSGVPDVITSTPVKDLIRVKSDEGYEQWIKEYQLHIAKRNAKILNDMSALDKAKFTTPYVRRFKKEYLEYIFTTAKYRYSPYTPQQRIVAENPAQAVDVQIQKFEVGRRFVGPVDVSVFNKSPFPLYDIGINLVYEATQGPARGRKVRGYLFIREPVNPGELKIFMNLYHLQPVPSFEGVDKVSFYVAGVKAGKIGNSR